MNYIFQELPYGYDALEPVIDKATVELHYAKHHKTYFDRFVAAIKETDFNGKPIEEVFANISKLSPAVKNNGGGYYNHELYWNCMSPKGGGEPEGKLKEAIVSKYGSFEAFKQKFEETAISQFGSGWAWLSVKDDKSLCVCSSSNQDNPLMDTANCKGKPILALDVWEHAYYLNYQNRRPEYVSNFWKVVNWNYVQGLYEKYTK